MRRNIISEVMREMGKKGGKAAGGKGGRKRMAALSPEERKALESKEAKARWAKAKRVSKRPSKVKEFPTIP
jgi:hypothetical protein